MYRMPEPGTQLELLKEGLRIIKSAHEHIVNSRTTKEFTVQTWVDTMEVLRLRSQDVQDHIVAIERRLPKPPSMWNRIKIRWLKSEHPDDLRFANGGYIDRAGHTILTTDLRLSPEQVLIFREEWRRAHRCTRQHICGYQSTCNGMPRRSPRAVWPLLQIHPLEVLAHSEWLKRQQKDSIWCSKHPNHYALNCTVCAQMHRPHLCNDDSQNFWEGPSQQ